MPAAPAIAAGVGGVGSLIGGAKGASAQQQQANAASGLYGSEEGIINNALMPYLQAMLPTANQLGQYLGTQVPGSVGATQTAANELGQYNPLAVGGLGNTIGSLQSYGASPIASRLANFNALSPAQMASLTSSLGQSGLSTINSIRGNLGGAANPNSLVQSLLNQNAQGGENALLGLGSEVAGQQLGALQSAGQMGLSGLQSAGTLGLGSSGQSLSGLQSGGGLAADLAQLGVGGIQGLANLGGSLSGQSLGGLQGIGNTYANAASNAGNPFGTAFGGLSQIIGSLPGYSQGNNSAPYDYNAVQANFPGTLANNGGYQLGGEYFGGH